MSLTKVTYSMIEGTIQRMMYYPHDLIAAELAALTA